MLAFCTETGRKKGTMYAATWHRSSPTSARQPTLHKTDEQKPQVETLSKSRSHVIEGDNTRRKSKRNPRFWRSLETSIYVDEQEPHTQERQKILAPRH